MVFALSALLTTTMPSLRDTEEVWTLCAGGPRAAFDSADREAHLPGGLLSRQGEASQGASGGVDGTFPRRPFRRREGAEEAGYHGRCD